jgi:hypothetical protein
MPLTLRPTALSSPAYRDWADYIVREDSRAVGRIYEDRHTLPGLRWFWSITMYVNPKLGITTSGRAPEAIRVHASVRPWASGVLRLVAWRARRLRLVLCQGGRAGAFLRLLVR